MEGLGERLESMRKGTQKEFAKLIGVPLNSYTNWVRGIREPSAGCIVTICTRLGISSDWLLGLPPAVHGSATATGDHAQAVAGSNITITNSSVTPPECPDCASCKYKAFAAAFKAIQSPL